MAAAATTAVRLVPPDWESELERLVEQAPGLPAAARSAVALVIENLIAESSLDPGQFESARSLLDAVGGAPPRSEPVREPGRVRRAA
jgi:hypothetical protein